MHRLIDLAQNRKLTIHSFGSRRSLIVAPITERTWLEHFFDKIFATVRCGAQAEISHDLYTPAINLLQEVAIGFEGYPQLAAAADWLSKIPLTDKLGYGDALLRVFEIKDPLDAFTPAPGRTHAVRIEAVWGAMSSGAMCRHTHLVHHFETPSKQQRERCRRAHMQTRRTAGFTRRGPVVFLAPEQPLTAHALAELYDELIVRVDGYAVNGELLSQDREKITAHMDAFHKVRAAGWLFSRVMPEIGRIA